MPSGKSDKNVLLHQNLIGSSILQFSWERKVNRYYKENHALVIGTCFLLESNRKKLNTFLSGQFGGGGGKKMGRKGGKKKGGETISLVFKKTWS